MQKQDILEKQVNYIYLGIGSNLGDKMSNIEKAKNLLINKKIYIENCSSFYETPSWPNKKFPKFLNIVIKVRTDLSLKNLFINIKKIEKYIGRKKSIRNHPRICDIDIIDFKGFCLETHVNNQRIQIPHPRMNERNFVIFPLYEVNKCWVHPKTGANISKIINRFSNEDFSDIRIVQN